MKTAAHLLGRFHRLSAALLPEPRVNLTRFRGLFASNGKRRALVSKVQPPSLANPFPVTNEPADAGAFQRCAVMPNT